METHISQALGRSEALQEAETILRSCVHCGFCTATCPTYQLLGNELDGPRGRIYLIKEMLENGQASDRTRTHLDRCLLCRSCETTCPSGVQYARLLHTGRHLAHELAPLPLRERGLRRLLRATLPYPGRMAPALGLARLIRPLLPRTLQRKIPPASPVTRPAQDNPSTQTRKVILFQGCVQSVAAGSINAAAIRVLNRLGIQTLAAAGESCCGAVNHHLDDIDTARSLAQNNLDRWLTLIDGGAEALVVTASACALEIREYPLLFPAGSPYHAKALRMQEHCLEIGDYLARQDLEKLRVRTDAPAMSFHAPCTLQHGLRAPGQTEALLRKAGFDVREPEEAHLCCGSAGTYAITQPRLSGQLRENKLRRLESTGGEVIGTANIGCLLHLQEKAKLRVRHWIEWLEKYCV
ncbi:MAG TPA: glycolate oxidase subunit GlcF [Thiolapillus brandeum]|uniref:Glycolate oxidase iron-sulfur subunit n=1 Tax=Thiolapillus brandeum TaxID=1076588 RepID=A0A831RZ68_9GAMM|nr:glycolate oxidase subunit GlcF [Thiolapillus brandeum]